MSDPFTLDFFVHKDTPTIHLLTNKLTNNYRSANVFSEHDQFRSRHNFASARDKHSCLPKPSQRWFTINPFCFICRKKALIPARSTDGEYTKMEKKYNTFVVKLHFRVVKNHEFLLCPDLLFFLKKIQYLSNIVNLVTT